MDSHQLRLERIADTEGTARLVNEQVLKANGESYGRDRDALFRCECGNEICDEPLSIPRDLYDRVRSDPMLFIVRPGHAVPEAEEVIERGEGYEIVRKYDEVRDLVVASDPRRPG
ncbi:MAG: hypothetical protein M3296_10235 [Actinomycetota bacterium]|nr:hypothetical protein [Actinomycetota bacterium]